MHVRHLVKLVTGNQNHESQTHAGLTV